MTGLVLKLGPKERVLINGAVIENGDRRSRLGPGPSDQMRTVLRCQCRAGARVVHAHRVKCGCLRPLRRMRLHHIRYRLNRVRRPRRQRTGWRGMAHSCIRPGFIFGRGWRQNLRIIPWRRLIPVLRRGHLRDRNSTTSRLCSGL